MPFAADTKARVMMALELPLNVPSYGQYVQEALTSVETYGGDVAVTKIETLLTQFEAAQTSLNSKAGDAGLIKADVLEWSETRKLQGYKDEMNRLRTTIARVLMLDDLMKSSSNRVRIRRG